MQKRQTWAQAACARILRPVVRLALAMGLKHPHLEELLREQLLEEATRLWQQKGVLKPNISQLSVTTGLHRKEVTQRVRQPPGKLPQTEYSSAAKTFTLWLQLASEDLGYHSLPVSRVDTGPSFEQIARQASRGDVHHRAVLDELVRLGMVNEADGRVSLATDGFVPGEDTQAMLAFLSDNARDHLQAAVSNVLGEQPRLLERAVFVGGLTPEDCDRIHQMTRQRWDDLHHELVGQMTQAVDKAAGTGSRRIRVGIYVYHEDVPKTSTTSDERQPTP